MMRRGFVQILTVVGLFAGLPGSSVQASTFLPDNLIGPCCEATTLNLPSIPSLTVRTKYVCWNDCAASLSGTVLTKFEAAEVACGVYLTRVTVTSLSGALTAWTGSLVMTYARTWAETSMDGGDPDLQVWRFFLNGDLEPSAEVLESFGSNACVVAPCVGTYSKFHVQGYLDLARDCTTGEFSVAFAFDHDCDAFEHDNSLTARPGSFHPGRSYTWVGPADGFECDPSIATAEGVALCEGLRTLDYSRPLDEICNFSQLGGGDVANTGEFCPCDSAGPSQYKTQDLLAFTICNFSTFVTSTSVGPWPAFVAKSIGKWTDPSTFPGEESLHIERGHAEFDEACEEVSTRPYFTGVQTQGGFATDKITPVMGGGVTLDPVVNRFLDLGSATFPGMMSAPRIGRLSVVDKMILLNVDDF